MEERRTILITGTSGFVGKYFFIALSRKNRVFGIDKTESCWTNFTPDISKKDELFCVLDKIDPDVVIHAAAYPDVEGCEKNPQIAESANVVGTRNVSEWCAKKDRKLVFLSTDYVYGNNGRNLNTEDSPIGHINNYTRTKIEGEKEVSKVKNHLIIRTGFIYGIDPDGKNFLMQMLSGREIVVAKDQFVNPTDVGFLSEALDAAIERDLRGVYNCNGKETIGRSDFARAIQRAFGAGKFTEKTTEEMKYAAKRPLIVSVDSSRIYKALGISPKTIEESLSEMRKEHDITKISTFRRTECRGCGGKNVEKIFSYGKMPVANSFRKKPDLAGVPLDVMFCSDCSLVQIWDVVSAENLFLDYRYLSSVSPALKNHFLGLAKTLKEKLALSEKSLILEIGSNDGIFQEQAKTIGLKVIGIEPARNVAALASEKGFEVICDFFGRESAGKIERERGKADLVLGCNVLAHIDDMKEVLLAVKGLLKEDGALVFEVHYVIDLVKNKEYDNIYHEHVNEYSLTAIKKMLQKNGMTLSDAEHIPNHGGSLRVYAKLSGEESPEVGRILREEETEGFLRKEKYMEFFGKIGEAKKVLFGRLNEIKANGGAIAAYGASARGTIFLNYCGIGLNLIDFIVDKSPEKQGRSTPRNAIPILAPEELRKRNPTHVLMAAYTYFAEIMKEQGWYEGTWIVPLPEYREIRK